MNEFRLRNIEKYYGKNKVLNKILMSLLRNIEKPKYIEIYSTNWSLTLNELITYEKNKAAKNGR